MKLRTSYFNAGVLKKDITRFAPLWGIYTVFMLLFLLLVGSDSSPVGFALNADSIMCAMAVVNFVYAGLVAILLFSDLYKNRLAYALHAMPLRREGWFLTHTAAGMLFCLVPNALGAVISAAMLGQYAYLAYIWLGLMLLEYLCFFGIGVFCALCAGNTLGAMAVYSLINFLSVLVAWLCKCFYEPVLFGITVEVDILTVLSPVLTLSSGDGYVDVWSNAGMAVFKGFQTGAWVYAFLCAFAGLVFLALGLLLYRRRNLETAGELISFRPAAPVFLVLYALCAGAVFYLVGIAFNSGEDVLLVIGLALGWITGKMLLEKRVNVFRVKTFLGLGALVFAFYLSVTVAWMDPVGITRYVPDPGKVESVMIAPYTSGYYFGTHSVQITDQATIERLTQIHERLVRERTENPEYMVLRLRYTMGTGVETERQYYLDPNSEDGQWLKTVYSRPEAVLGIDQLSEMKQTLRYAEVYGYRDELSNAENPKDFWKVDPDDYSGLLDAIWADCQAGNMVQMWEYHNGESHVATLNLQFGSSNFRDVLIYESCTNTVEYLKQQAAEE